MQRSITAATVVCVLYRILARTITKSKRPGKIQHKGTLTVAEHYNVLWRQQFCSSITTPIWHTYSISLTMSVHTQSPQLPHMGTYLPNILLSLSSLEQRLGNCVTVATCAIQITDEEAGSLQ